MEADVCLPASKSEGNRLIVMSALANDVMPSIGGVCDDISDLRQCIINGKATGECRVKESGTALRFLTAFFAVNPPYGRTTVIRCSGRLAERPLETLLEALEEVGMPHAIVIKDEGGEKRVSIESSPLEGGSISLSTSVSTQYASALLLIAPYMRRGLRITLRGSNVSSPYIDMTLALMKRCGAGIEQRLTTDGREIEVKAGSYGEVCDVEADWSAASFFYEYTALNGGRLLLRGLGSPENSLQGDSEAATLFSLLGVATTPCKEGVVIDKRGDTRVKRIERDMRHTPDLVIPFVVACCFSGVHFRIYGLEALRHKESDRLSSVCEAMRAMGYRVEEKWGNELIWGGERTEGLPAGSAVDDASDHRVAMAIEASCRGYRALHPECVSKSFPEFYKQIRL